MLRKEYFPEKKRKDAEDKEKEKLSTLLSRGSGTLDFNEPGDEEHAESRDTLEFNIGKIKDPNK